MLQHQTILDMVVVEAVALAASKKVNEMLLSSRKSPPPKKRSIKQRLKSKVKDKTIDYAKSNPKEVVKCYRHSENPKRRLALQAMGIKGKMKKDEKKKGKANKVNSNNKSKTTTNKSKTKKDNISGKGKLKRESINSKGKPEKVKRKSQTKKNEGK